MTASTKPKTPSMTMTIPTTIPVPTIDSFCKKASRLTLAQVIDVVTVTESLIVNPNDQSTRTKHFTIDIAFFPASEYTTEYDINPKDILAVFGAMFPLILRKEIVAEMKKLEADLKGQMAELGKGKKPSGDGVPGAGDENEDVDDSAEPKGRSGKDDDEESEVGDGDASGEKMRRQTKQVATYESDEDEEDAGSEGEFGDAGVEAAYADKGDSEDEDQDGEKKSRKSKVSGSLKAAVAKIEQEFLQHFPQATSFKFTESGCTIELEVNLSTFPLIDALCSLILIIRSSGLTCRNCSLWASLSALASRPSSAKSPTSQTVSAYGRTARTVASRYAFYTSGYLFSCTYYMLSSSLRRSQRTAPISRACGASLAAVKRA